MKIRFTVPSLRRSRRRAAIGNRLRCLRIGCYDAADGQTLLSTIALSKGAELGFTCGRSGGTASTVNGVLSGTSTTHLSNILSPTHIEYCAGTARAVRLFGPNGTALFCGYSNSDIPFLEFRQLPLANIRYLYLDMLESTTLPPATLLSHNLSFLPALETFAIARGVGLSHLSGFLSNPSASPSLKH